MTRECSVTHSASARRRGVDGFVSHRLIAKDVKTVPTATMTDARH